MGQPRSKKAQGRENERKRCVGILRRLAELCGDLSVSADERWKRDYFRGGHGELLRAISFVKGGGMFQDRSQEVKLDSLLQTWEIEPPDDEDSPGMLFVAELIGRLGMDREAMERSDEPIGNQILEVLDARLAVKP
jgi:hypothetical protein